MNGNLLRKPEVTLDWTFYEDGCLIECLQLRETFLDTDRVYAALSEWVREEFHRALGRALQDALDNYDLFRTVLEADGVTRFYLPQQLIDVLVEAKTRFAIPDFPTDAGQTVQEPRG